MNRESISNTRKLTITEFVGKAPEEFGLEFLAGESGGQERTIISGRIQKLGLALAGFAHYIHSGRIQIVGQSEISYLDQLDSEGRLEAIGRLSLESISCILITKNLEPPPELLTIANEAGLPVIKTHLVSSLAISKVSRFLEDFLAPRLTIHGVLLGVYGLGILILGDSGIGKSECALDLITRGHRLISDDSVIVKKIGEDVEGSSPELTHEHIEIRGLGIINVKDLFGISAVGDQIRIDLCIELKRWNEATEIDRLGIDSQREMFFGISIPKYILPVSSGRNLATLIETAIRLHLVNKSGSDAATALIEKHSRLVSAGIGETDKDRG